MKVLFIGGTGTISTGVASVAVERDIELFLLNRGSSAERAPKGAHLLQGDIHDEKAVAALLEGRHFDAVVDWVAFTTDTDTDNIHCITWCLMA